MEKREKLPEVSHTTLKNMLAVGALSFVLLGNSDNVVAQTQQTKQDLAKNINKTNEDIVKQYFVNNFAPVVNSIDNISDIPLKIKYKNPDFALKHNFPDSIDINPKIIKGGAKRLVTLILDDKKYNIVPYKGIKIKNMKIVPNKDLDDPKAILTLELMGFLPWDIEISCREFAQYVYDLSRMDAGQKKTIWGIHVEVVKVNPSFPRPKSQNNHIADSNIQENNTDITKNFLK